MAKEITCGFLGHRRLWGYLKVDEILYNEIEKLIKSGVTKFLIGSHGEFDKMALSVCNKLKSVYKHIEIFVVITSISYLKKINNATIKTIMYPIEDEYFKNKITISNRYMVNECDIIVCFIDENYGKSGAKNAVKYAIKSNKKILNIFNLI